mmetsp:Transcript_3530/g.6185  ORF Transcript_3530/g.6185 Transcript_3530/m.6185 type:complete len:212 (-) Transcript_3530:85-720(-)
MHAGQQILPDMATRRWQARGARGWLLERIFAGRWGRPMRPEVRHFASEHSSAANSDEEAGHDVHQRRLRRVEIVVAKDGGHEPQGIRRQRGGKVGLVAPLLSIVGVGVGAGRGGLLVAAVEQEQLSGEEPREHNVAEAEEGRGGVGMWEDDLRGHVQRCCHGCHDVAAEHPIRVVEEDASQEGESNRDALEADELHDLYHDGECDEVVCRP